MASNQDTASDASLDSFVDARPPMNAPTPPEPRPWSELDPAPDSVREALDEIGAWDNRIAVNGTEFIVGRHGSSKRTDFRLYTTEDGRERTSGYVGNLTLRKRHDGDYDYHDLIAVRPAARPDDLDDDATLSVEPSEVLDPVPVESLEIVEEGRLEDLQDAMDDFHSRVEKSELRSAHADLIRKAHELSEDGAAVDANVLGHPAVEKAFFQYKLEARKVIDVVAQEMGTEDEYIEDYRRALRSFIDSY